MKTICKQMVRLAQSAFVAWVLVVLSLAACADDSGVSGSEQQGDGQEITLSVPFALSAMENRTGEGITRAEENKLPEEMVINKLYMLQFDGTADAAKLLQCKSLTVDGVTGGSGSVNCMFRTSQSGSPQQTVYLVANVDLSSYENNTTLTKSAFLASLAGFAPATSVPATGLPYMASNEFDPMAVTADFAPEFSLEAMVAKVNYTYSMDAGLKNYLSGEFTLTLKRVASGTGFGIPTTVSGAYTPIGLTRTAVKELGKLTVPTGPATTATTLTGTVYFPENIAGRTTGIKKDIERSLTKSPEVATYLELSGFDITKRKTVKYVFFLGDPANLNDFNVKRNCRYKVTNNIAGASLMDDRVTVTEDVINLSVNGKTANCYVLTESTRWYSFDATKRGNGDESLPGINYPSLPDLSKAVNVRVIWDIGSVINAEASSKTLPWIDKDGKVYFCTGSGVGNAVIGIFSSPDSYDCLWSWHIWKVSDGELPRDIKGSKTPVVAGTSNEFYIMNRNLGASSATAGNAGTIGLLYQWGRKDPFPGAADFNATEPNITGWYAYEADKRAGTWSGKYAPQSMGGKDEATTTKYPAMYWRGRESGQTDWMETSNNNLWGTPSMTVQGKKSIYDPCPIGYRVPPHDTWSKLTFSAVDYQGAYLTGAFIAWFPSTGYRNAYDGSGGLSKIGGSGVNGTYWSANANGTSGAAINYNSSNKTVNSSSGGRACAYPVRCVRE